MFNLKKFIFFLSIQCIFILINSNFDTFVLSFETNYNRSNFLSNQNSTIHLKRTKRGVFQLSGIIKCTTGCKPLSYRRYGCFCGYMGSGQPVDNIDKCCQEHDYCYSHTTCAHLMVYLLPYQWKCTESGEAKCATLENTKTAADKCSYQLCECDRILGECLSKHECPTNRPVCIKQTDQV